MLSVLSSSSSTANYLHVRAGVGCDGQERCTMYVDAPTRTHTNDHVLQTC